MDALLDGLLSQSDSFTVHLGTAAVDISPSMPLNGFLDAFYPEYAPALWLAVPLAVDLRGAVFALPGSVTFAAPSQMPQELWNVWVTYLDGGGQVQLLEAWQLPGAPVPFGPGGSAIIVNLGLKLFEP